MSQTPTTRRTATDAISMADRIEWTPRRGTCTSAAARSAPRSCPEATPVAPRRHGASTYVSRVDGRRGDGSARPLELRTGSEPSGANGSRRRPTMPTRVRRAPIAATPTAQRARSRDVVRRWGRSQRDSGAGRRRHPSTPRADGRRRHHRHCHRRQRQETARRRTQAQKRRRAGVGRGERVKNTTHSKTNDRSSASRGKGEKTGRDRRRRAERAT